jgi:hypothetical protein
VIAGATLTSNITLSSIIKSGLYIPIFFPLYLTSIGFSSTKGIPLSE